MLHLLPFGSWSVAGGRTHLVIPAILSPNLLSLINYSYSIYSNKKLAVKFQPIYETETVRDR